MLGAPPSRPLIHPQSSDLTGCRMATLTFKCKPKDDKLEVTIVSCEGLPDLDGALNLTDPYVVVRVGKEKQKTKAVGGALNPEFDEETSTFLFEVRSLAI